MIVLAFRGHMMPSELVKIAENSDFTIDNIPFGIFSTEADKCRRVGSAIGDFVIDLREAARIGVFDNSIMKPFARDVFSRDYLNGFMMLGREFWRAARKDIQNLLLMEDNDVLLQSSSKILVKMNEVVLHLPFQVGDYTDFYSSKEHATNVGIMFRGKDNALQPNW